MLLNTPKRLLLLLLFSLAAITAVEGEEGSLDGESHLYSEDETAVSENLQGHIDFFSGLGSRMVGHEGNSRAAEYIHEQFEQIGLRDVTQDPFRTTSPVDKGASIQVGDGDIHPLYGLWPNMVRTPTVPPEGVEGTLIYAEKGEYADYQGYDMGENIVVLDFNSDNNWLKAAEMGAKAIIFIEPEDTVTMEAERKYVEVPLNVPRFMITREDFKALEHSLGQNVTVKGRMDWELAETWNVYGHIEGVNPDIAHEIVVVSAYYDSISVVPAVAPGADAASGISALFELADHLQENPPERTVVFLATSGHFLGLKGITDFVNKRTRDASEFVDDVVDPLDIHLFLGLELSSQHDEMGIFQAGELLPIRERTEAAYLRTSRDYGSLFEAHAQTIEEELGVEAGRYFIDGITPPGARDWRSFIPFPIATDAEVVKAVGRPAFSLVTTHNFRDKIDTPVDVIDKVDFENLTHQVQFLRTLLPLALNDPDLPDRKEDMDDVFSELIARYVVFDPRESFVPDTPVEGAVAFVRNFIRKTSTGVRSSFYGLTNEDGEAVFSPTRPCGPHRPGIQLEAYKMDKETGDVYLAPDRGVHGAGNYPMDGRVRQGTNRSMVVLAEFLPTEVYGLVDPRFLTQLDMLDIFNEGNTTPPKYGYSVSTIRREHTSNVEPYGVAFSEAGNRMKLGLSSSILGYRFLHLNSKSAETEVEARGEGYDPAGVERITHGAFRSAYDMYYLNEYRMERYLRRYGIRNERLDVLHRRAGESLRAAENAEEDRDWHDFRKHSLRASAIESRAYPDVSKTIDDVIIGVIFYMFLLIPFAYFMERLTFGFVDLRKQIFGIAFIFLLSYLIMRWVHPAFSIADAPEVILLGFIMLTLTGIVVTLIYSKFQDQMELLKQKKRKVYETDVGRLSASVAAFRLGVSNMKKRKIRTTLTSITLVLLTFTVLSFTSISSYMRFSQVRRPNEPAYEGALIRDRVWQPIQKPAFEQIKMEFGDVALVSPRAWLLNRDRQSSFNLSLRANGEHAYGTSALGLSSQEKNVSNLHEFLVEGSWFDQQDYYACILPDYMAGLLGLDENDVGEAEVTIMGKPHLLKGIIDSDNLRYFVDLDNAPIAPANFTQLPPHMESEVSVRQDVDVYAALETFTHQNIDNVVFLPYERVLHLGGTIQSIAVRFDEGEDIRGRVEDFVSRLAITVFAGVDDNVSVYSSTGSTSFAGMGGLFIPILIAASIILNTMMGSVYERFNEIGIFSSVGLAPVHIGALFIAEASVYAVLGGVSGYMAGQVMAKVLTEFGMLAGLTLNYSSLAAVFSTMLVMAVVLLSTIYPAKKAAQMAVPDVTRRWQLPEPQGTKWEFDFPFTISGKEALGLYLFLSEYFTAYEEGSIGDFYTHGTILDSYEDPQGEGYVIAFMCWLAPYDLGVSQDVKMYAHPTEDNIYEINVELNLLSGQPSNWKRLNRRFLNILRKQFLIWRTVDMDVKKEYTERGLEYLNKKNTEEDK